MTRLAPRNLGRAACAILLAWLAIATAPQSAAQDRYGFGGPAIPESPAPQAGGDPRGTATYASASTPSTSAPGPSLTPQATTPGEPVVDVRIENNRTIAASRVLGQLKTRVGRPFDEETVRQDVQKLYRLGWFAYVQPYYQQTPHGKIVVLRVTERPTIRYVEYLGNYEIKPKSLDEKTGVKYGDTLDPYRVEQGARKIEEFYKSKGFNRVQVNVVEGLKPQDIGVVYAIHEGPKQKIQWVEFIGNDSGFVRDWRLKVLVESKPGMLWLFKGEVDGQKIQEDVRRIEDYYRAFGFFQAKVQRELEFNEDGTWATLRFVIHEGPRFQVKNVTIKGNEKFATQDLLERMQLKPGEPFEKSKLDSDRSWLTDLYGSQGHVFADIKANIVYPREPGELNLEYEIAEGERWRVGRIFVHIGGENPHTKVTTAINRISLAPGDIVDTREIKASERRLIASNLFHRDPTRGVAPRITYRIPELDGRNPRGLAGGRDTFRGQSPDSPSRAASSPRHAAYRPPNQAPADQANSNTGRIRENVQVVPGLSAPEMHLHFEDPRHVQQWWGHHEATHPQTAERGQPAAVSRAPRQEQRPRNEAYRHLLAPEGGQPAPAGSATYRDPNSRGPEPALIYRGQNAGAWGEPIRYGGMGVGAVGPDRDQSATDSPRVAQGSPAFDPNRPLSPNSPGTLPPPISPGQVYGLQPVDPLLSPYGDPTVDVYVDLEETQTGRFMAGVGVNSDAGIVGSIVIDEGNFDWRRVPSSWAEVGNAFRGGGQRFRLEAAPGSEVQRYLASWSDPYWRGTPFSLGLAGSYFDRRFRDWDEQRLGGRVSFGYQWPRRDIEATIAYRGENVNIHDPFLPAPPELQEVLGDNVLHGFRLSVANDTRDSAFLATMGHYVELSFEQVIGSFDYPRAVLDMRKYFLVRQRPDRSGRHVLSYSTRLGVTGSNTPLYDHFFAGGYSTLRGFDFRGASPVNFGVEVGGEFMWINTLEYLMPVTADDMFHVVGFVDFGTVERDVSIRDFRVAPGLGLRVTVPAMGPAPIALDFAWPIQHADFDDREVFSFHVGLQRM